MDIELKCPGNISKVVEIEAHWSIGDLRNAAAEIIDCKKHLIELVIDEEIYGESRNNESLENLGLQQNEVVTVKAATKAVALARLAARDITPTVPRCKAAMLAGLVELVRDFFEAGYAPYERDLALKTLEAGRPGIAMVILSTPTVPPLMHFNTNLLGIALRKGYLDVVTIVLRNLTYVNPNCCVYLEVPSSNWEPFFDVLMEHKVQFELPCIAHVVNTLTAAKLRYFLARYPHKIPLSCLGGALSRSDATHAELILDHSLILSAGTLPALAQSKHHHLDSKVAHVIRKVYKDIYYKPSKKSTTRCLIRACGNGAMEIITALVEAGGDAGVGLLHCKDAATAKHLVEECQADVNYAAAPRTTPLIRACAVGLDFVKYLVEKGAEVNRSAGNTSAVIVASKHGKLDIVKYLVEDCKADPTHRTAAGFDAASAAAAHGHLTVMQYLLRKINPARSYPNNMNLIHVMAKTGTYTRELCKATGENLFEADSLGRDVLMFAGMGRAKVHEDLVAECKDLASRTSDDGTTALGYAVQTGHEDTVVALLDAGSNPKAALSNHTKNTVIDGYVQRTKWDINIYNKLNARITKRKGPTSLHSLIGSNAGSRKVNRVTADCTVWWKNTHRVEYFFELAARDPELILYISDSTSTELNGLLAVRMKKNGQSILRILAENESTPLCVFRKILGKNQDAMGTPDPDGVSPFRAALEYGHFDAFYKQRHYETIPPNVWLNEYVGLLRDGKKIKIPKTSGYSEKHAHNCVIRICSHLIPTLSEDEQVFLITAYPTWEFLHLSRRVANKILPICVTLGHIETVTRIMATAGLFSLPSTVVLPETSKKGRDMWEIVCKKVPDPRACLVAAVEHYDGHPVQSRYKKLLKNL
eukprot:TRINITY_DN4349_c0_g2_i1.p1 TRINITY_DN4349_c0_g2~~TRINITY_DN4349_c0_g2_i1.p1  ORF type:complete len:888 (+),score=129.13 TRINITY_DN4349_c0_g2_i1:46-2664(+)